MPIQVVFTVYGIPFFVSAFVSWRIHSVASNSVHDKSRELNLQSYPVSVSPPLTSDHSPTSKDSALQLTRTQSQSQLILQFDWKLQTHKINATSYSYTEIDQLQVCCMTLYSDYVCEHRQISVHSIFFNQIATIIMLVARILLSLYQFNYFVQIWCCTHAMSSCLYLMHSCLYVLIIVSMSCIQSYSTNYTLGSWWIGNVRNCSRPMKPLGLNFLQIVCMQEIWEFCIKFVKF